MVAIFLPLQLKNSLLSPEGDHANHLITFYHTQTNRRLPLDSCVNVMGRNVINDS